jgi:hypothetical protein
VRHKWPFCTQHITVLPPRLMMGGWRKSLEKEVDLIMEIPAGVPFWESSMHEPLILYIISLPLCRHPPWMYKRTGFMEGLHRELYQVWKGVPEWGRSLLRHLLQQEREFHSLQKGKVWKLLWNYDRRSAPDLSSGKRRWIHNHPSR